MCKLLTNLNHTCELSTGGVSQILLIDYEDFLHYKFKHDKLYNTCFVERIYVRAEYVSLETTDQTAFSEDIQDQIHRQQLTTTLRGLDAEKTANLMLAKQRKYVVAFKSGQKWFTFGSDGGASIEFQSQSGQVGEASGHSISITKQSIYPVFETENTSIEITTLLFNETFNEKFK